MTQMESRQIQKLSQVSCTCFLHCKYSHHKFQINPSVNIAENHRKFACFCERQITEKNEVWKSNLQKVAKDLWEQWIRTVEICQPVRCFQKWRNYVGTICRGAKIFNPNWTGHNKSAPKTLIPRRSSYIVRLQAANTNTTSKSVAPNRNHWKSWIPFTRTKNKVEKSFLHIIRRNKLTKCKMWPSRRRWVTKAGC